VKTIACRTILVGSALVIATGLLGCSKDQENSASTSASAASASAPAKAAEETIKIGLLLPEAKTARYEAADRPFFVARLKEICPKCEVLYQNADQKADKQQAQAESMLTNGVKVLVIDPVDAKAAAGIVTKAKAQNVAVLAYERLAQGPADYHVSFDNERVGKLQGQALLDALKKGGDPKRAHRSECRVVQEGRTLGARWSGDHRTRVRHAGLEPGRGPEGNGPSDHGTW